MANKFYFDGCDTTELAKKHGTPLYVISETNIQEQIDNLKKDFINKYENTRVAYAAKAFYCLAMAKFLIQNNICVDVVSGGELYTSLKAGFPAEKIEFNGNNKTIQELEMAVEAGVGRIIVDGLTEVSLIEKICQEKNKTMNILFRVTPGVKSDSHDYIVTGKKDSKFGIPLDDDVILPQVKAALDSKYVKLLGFHFHVGSQLFDNTSHLQALDIILNLIDKTDKEFGFIPEEINLGGGFGVKYVNENRKPFSYFLDPMMEKIKTYYESKNLSMPAVVIEPGRSIVAEAGITLYTIGQIKEIQGVRKYVSVDGGMGDNIRPALYQAVYNACIANKYDSPAEEVVTISGKCCESGDILIKDINLPKAEAGDILAIFSTGAYGYSMSSNYNRNPIPEVVMVKGGESRTIIKRQTYDDLLRNDL